RTRAADRTPVAELVRRLPAKTAVVDLVEHWQWSPPSPVAVAAHQTPASPPIRAAGAAQKKGAPAPKGTLPAQKKAAPREKKAAPAQNKAAARQNEVASSRLPTASPTGSSESWVRKRYYDAFVLRPDTGDPGWSAEWLELRDADTLDHLLDGWIAS